jgi:hypothetical protein
MGATARQWLAGIWLLLLGVIALWSEVAFPAASPPPDDNFDALFQRIFKEPLNLDLAFHFAEVATQRGDYEAAIGALERMLFYNPGLPRVRLELGVLYFKLGSYAMARTYFDSAIATPGVPPEVKAKVDQFLAEIDRRLSPHKWSVFLQSGLRYQTNANAGPDGLMVKALGQDAVLNSQFAKSPDWNWFGLVGATYAYDLQDGNGDAIEAGLTGYYAKQFSLTQFDLGLVEVQVGPRFGVPQLFPGASFKMYGIGTATSLGGAPYFDGLGGGVSMRFPFSAALVEPSVELRNRNFMDSTLYPTASQQSGNLLTAAITAEGPVLNYFSWAGRVAFDNNRTSDAIFDFNNYQRWSADVAFPIPWSIDWNKSTLNFVIAPTAGVSRTAYAMPNPIVSPTVTRLDREWHVGTILDFLYTASFGMRTQLQYSETNSTLPNYDTRNLSISFGPTARF